MLDKLLAPERRRSRSAVAGADIDLGLVEEFHGSVATATRLDDPTWKDLRRIARQSPAPWFPTPPPLSLTTAAPLAGIGLMTAGIFMFAVNDTMGKWLVATYSVGQVLLIRGLAGAGPAGAVHLAGRRATFGQAPRWGTAGAASGAGHGQVGFFYWAVSYLCRSPMS